LYRLNHFAPTELAKQNLFAEGVASDEIHVTGNTIVDSLRFMIAKIADDRELQLRIAERFPVLTPGRKLVLVTGHRRESFGPVSSKFVKRYGASRSGATRSLSILFDSSTGLRRYFASFATQVYICLWLLTSNGRSHPLESGVEIRLQILDVFEADGKAQGGTWRIPLRHAAITPAIEGNDKTLEAAP
jgi:hypothetical protein